MRLSRPEYFSTFIAVIISIAFIILFYFTESLIYHNVHWWALCISAFGIFFTAYFLIKYATAKFIYDKIRPIYKTIFNMKVPKGKENQRYYLNGDIISNANQQVIKWAEDKKEEINSLRKLETYRREFLGNVSHELKTPIFNIQGYILTLLDGGIEDPVINKEYLLRSEKSINRMINIVQDLETISRLESGELVPIMNRFDIVVLVKEVFEFLEIHAMKNNIDLLPGNNFEKPLYVNADKEKIRQVLINLIENSIKYGTEHGHTKVSFFDMDENILVEVTDNGIGVAQQDIPRLFERFFRTDKGRSRDQVGTGLGLAIVKHIIEAHNQTINVRSTPGIGTTFAFTLQKI
jgi:two-component system, OmpR family, phosphate regulon sensor histidine kinase PhoR